MTTVYSCGSPLQKIHYTPAFLETPLWGLKIMHSPCVVFSILALLTEGAHNYECCTIFGEMTEVAHNYECCTIFGEMTEVAHNY
jgi:nitroimidazol reductase NimA-like FMN-containing flavoprotein (pyridoxamine 5'-phosphate oxidase superfamily)